MAPKTDTSWHDRFLEALKDTILVYKACEVAHISRQTAYNHKADFPEFGAQWDAIIEKRVDDLEKVAFKRAEEGSDTMLIFILKSRRRKIYGDHKHLHIEPIDSVDWSFTVKKGGDET